MICKLLADGGEQGDHKGVKTRKPVCGVDVVYTYEWLSLCSGSKENQTGMTVAAVGEEAFSVCQE